MNRAMFSGVAGLKTHQTRMDVIGNNISNVNTVGYKSQTALFADLLYQNSSNATGPNPETNIGGTNAKQVGLGAKVASISTNITLPGSAETTNNPFDLRITGDSFFIVNNGSENLFTRDGSFKVDAAGNLVMSANGYKVQGWLPETDGSDVIKKDTVTALQIMNAANLTYPAAATTEAHVSGIVDAESPEVNSPDGKLMNLNFYDSRGYSYTAKLAIKRVGDSNDKVNSYSCELVKLLDAEGNVLTDSGAEIANMSVPLKNAKSAALSNGYTLSGTGPYTISYIVDAKTGEEIEYTIADGNNGISAKRYATTADKGTNTSTALSEEEAWKGVAAAFGYTDPKEFQNMQSKVGTDTYDVATQLATLITETNTANSNTDPAKTTLTFTGKYISGCVIDFSKDNGAFVGLNGGAAKVAVLDFSTVGDAMSFRPINIDFSALSNVGNGGVSTAAATSGSLENEGEGRMIGRMKGVQIGNDGKIYATYDNGQRKLLGQVAVAQFANPSGLEKAGENLYKTTQNSGAFDGIGMDVTADGGKMSPGELESSNVDLSGELTSMIVTQRGFQANSRIITVSDTMLEELINLKR